VAATSQGCLLLLGLGGMILIEHAADDGLADATRGVEQGRNRINWLRFSKKTIELANMVTVSSASRFCECQ
jgi:hypothetical protein